MVPNDHDHKGNMSNNNNIMTLSDNNNDHEKNMSNNNNNDGVRQS